MREATLEGLAQNLFRVVNESQYPRKGGTVAMRMDENQEKKSAPGTEPYVNEKERLAADLDLVTRRCQELREVMTQQLFLISSEGNRRIMADAAGDGRRQGERRDPDRAGPGRRQLADRRMPPEERLSMLGSQMMQLVEQSIALTDQRRYFERAEL